MARDLFAFYPYGKRSSASARYRGFGPCEVLAARGEPVEIFNPEHISRYKVVVLQKRFHPRDRQLARKLQAAGCKVVLDISDNHYYTPIQRPRLLQRAWRLKRMLAVCDGLTVPTKALAKAVSHPNVHVVDDLIDLPTMPAPRNAVETPADAAAKTPFRLVWFGNAGAEVPRFGLADLATAIPALNTLAAHRPISLTVISNNESLANEVLKPAAFKTNYVPWTLDGHEAVIADHDACIIPISRNPFTACKSPNRVILSLWLGVPVVADYIDSYAPFEHCIGFGDWVKNIDTLAANPQLGTEQVERGRQQINSEFAADVIADRWLEILRGLE